MAENPIDIRTGKPATDAEMRRRAKVADALRVKKTRPASGVPASGVEAGGYGIGGKANGPGSAVPIGEHPESFNALTMEQRKAKALDKQTRADALMENLLEIAFDPEVGAQTRLNATVAAQNRDFGTPVQMVITDNQPIAQPLALVAKYPKAVNE